MGTPAFLQNIGIFELLCILMVFLLVFGGILAAAVVLFVLLRPKRKPCPHCGVSIAKEALSCGSCGQNINDQR